VVLQAYRAVRVSVREARRAHPAESADRPGSVKAARREHPQSVREARQASEVKESAVRVQVELARPQVRVGSREYLPVSLAAREDLQE
jgi:hypothetical protein